MTCRALAWESSDVGDRLTTAEVDKLVECTQELASVEQLTNGKYVGANVVLYWHRLPTHKEN